MFSVLMATWNLGEIFSKQFGGVLTYFLGITANNFDNLWILMTISSLSQIIPVFLLNLFENKKSLDLSEIIKKDEFLSEDNEI